MSVPFTPCFYHPEKAAITVCERCRRPICLEDKRIFKDEETKHSYFYFYYGLFNSKTIVKRFDLCVLCNGTMLKLKANSSKDSLKFLPFIGLLFLIAIFALTRSTNNLIWVVLTVILLIIVSLGIIAPVIINLASERDAKIDVLTLLMNAHIQTGSTTRVGSAVNANNISLNSSSNPVKKINNLTKSLDAFSLQCYECGSQLTLQDKFSQNCGNTTHEELIDFYHVAKKEL